MNNLEDWKKNESIIRTNLAIHLYEHGDEIPKDFASKLCVTKKTVQRVASGKIGPGYEVGIDKIADMANALNLTYDDLTERNFKKIIKYRISSNDCMWKMIIALIAMIVFAVKAAVSFSYVSAAIVFAAAIEAVGNATNIYGIQNDVSWVPKYRYASMSLVLISTLIFI